MDDDGQVQLLGQLHLTTENRLLEFPGGILRPVVVQADLADGNHFFMAAQRPDGVKIRIGTPGAVLRVNAHSGVNVGILLRQGHSLAGALRVTARVHHQPHPGSGEGGQDLVPVGVEAVGIVMGMGIKNGHESTSHHVCTVILPRLWKKEISRL